MNRNTSSAHSKSTDAKTRRFQTPMEDAKSSDQQQEGQEVNNIHNDDHCKDTIDSVVRDRDELCNAVDTTNKVTTCTRSSSRKRRAVSTAPKTIPEVTAAVVVSGTDVLDVFPPPPATSLSAAAAAATVSSLDMILANAFTNPYIKSIIQQQEQHQQEQQQQHSTHEGGGGGGGGGIYLQPAINLIRQSSSIFLYKFITAISEQLLLNQQQPNESHDVDRMESSTPTTDGVCEDDVLRTIREIISDNTEYQFLIGTLDNIEQETINANNGKTKKKSTSVLLPESLLLTTKHQRPPQRSERKKTPAKPVAKRPKKKPVSTATTGIMNDLAVLVNHQSGDMMMANTNDDDDTDGHSRPPQTDGEHIDGTATAVTTAPNDVYNHQNQQQQRIVLWDEENYD